MENLDINNTGDFEENSRPWKVWFTFTLSFGAKLHIFDVIIRHIIDYFLRDHSILNPDIVDPDNFPSYHAGMLGY